MAYSYLSRDCRVTLRDGTPTTPITKTFVGQLDDVGLSGLVGQQREWIVIRNKDGVHSRRKNKVKFINFNLSVILDKNFADAAEESFHHWLNRTGPFASGGAKPLLSVDDDSDGFVFAALIEWLDEDGNVADSVVLSHVHADDGSISPGDSYVQSADLVSTGTQVWA